MKENVLDVLLYLFQNFLADDTDTETDRESMQSELLEAGFPSREVNQAFDWLDGLAARQQAPMNVAGGARSFRIFTEHECARLDVEERGFILYLEQTGVLTAETRELVMDRVMALDAEDIDGTQLKWVILMVLFNQPGHEDAYACVEDMLFDEFTGYLH